MSANDFFALWTQNKTLLALLILVNLAGTAFGVYYYAPQFAASPVWAWPVIFDSPMWTAFFAVSLMFLLFGKRLPGALATITIFGLVKVGVWTVLTILLYSGFFLTPDNFWYYLTLLVLHAGMIAEAGVLWKYANFDLGALRPAVIWFLINDFADYYLGTVPWPVPTLGNPLYISLLGAESFAATLALTVGLWWWGNRKAEQPLGRLRA